MKTLNDVRETLREFVGERDWHQFHTPKNLATALLCEAAELAEIFQWLTPEQSSAAMQDPKRAEAIRDELADVLSYLVRMADVLEVDLIEAMSQKIVKNREKYPVSVATGAIRRADHPED